MCEGGQLRETVDAVDHMVKQRKRVSVDTLSSILQVCSKHKDLVQGKRVHMIIIEIELQWNTKLAVQLIRMFSSCGSLLEAFQAFTSWHVHNVYTWTAIILAHAQHGQGEQAMTLYSQMQISDVEPNSHTFVAVLKACASVAALEQGMLIHGDILKLDLESNLFVGNTLVDVYCKCGSLEDARQVFDRLVDRDVVSWNVMLSGYVQCGQGLEAFRLFQKMQQEKVIEPNYVTLVCILKSCATMDVLFQVHADIMEQGLESELSVGNTLVDMYAKYGGLEDAHTVFDKLLVRDVVLWSTMIIAYFEHGHTEKALQFFERMQEVGIKPDKVTFGCILKACASIAALDQVKMIHAETMKQEFDSDLFIGSILVDVYAKCSSLEDSCKLFDELSVRDVVSWSAMITGYAERGHVKEAIQLYKQMQQEGIQPDEVTFVCVLKACSRTASLDQGMLIHADIVTQGIESNMFVGSTVVDMYAKGCSLEDAREVFGKLPRQDVVLWNGLIAGHIDHGYYQEALCLFKKMQKDGIEPDKVTFVYILKACACVASLDQGRLIHADIRRRGFQDDPFIGSILVDMYAKCGSLEEAHNLFNKLPARDVVSWNAMIAGYAEHGHSKNARRCFHDMQQEGVKPDNATFVSLLSACSHTGLVEEGRQYFKCMNDKFGLVPMIKHYICMVDILGRAGLFDAAKDFVFKMPCEPDSAVWMTLLGACAKYGNLDLGRRLFDCLFKIDCRNATGYVLMSNIYAVNSMWDDAHKILEMRVHERAWKAPGKSWIVVNKKTHVFHVNDASHPQSDKVYVELNRLKGPMKESGYWPHLDSVLHPIAEADKEDALCGHSEKLALAFGLISNPPGIPLRIFKNLRMCVDCHNATRVISKIAGRDIIQRDARRFHYFKDGVCSCGNFW